jgi:hypothetical protein
MTSNLSPPRISALGLPSGSTRAPRVPRGAPAPRPPTSEIHGRHVSSRRVPVSRRQAPAPLPAFAPRRTPLKSPRGRGLGHARRGRSPRFPRSGTLNSGSRPPASDLLFPSAARSMRRIITPCVQATALVSVRLSSRTHRRFWTRQAKARSPTHRRDSPRKPAPPWRRETTSRSIPLGRR